MEKELIITEDGSHSIYVPELKENYHSEFGAIQESKKIFIEAGLQKVDKWLKPVNVLEVGFGTGLNALLTYYSGKEIGLKINYIGVEPNPLTPEIVSKLNYPEQINEEDARNTFIKIHKRNLTTPLFVSDNFIIFKVEEKLENITLKEQQFNLVYFDAFSPDVQPELWTVDIFKKLYTALEDRGILVTYSAKGDVKRALKEAGFRVELLPGPKGKREFIRAIKDSDVELM